MRSFFLNLVVAPAPPAVLACVDDSTLYAQVVGKFTWQVLAADRAEGAV
jgi:hypothetical protein